MLLLVLLLCAIALLGSAILTYILRRYAIAKSLMDIPNARSSHSIPTPRGGGLSFVIIFLIFLPILNWFNFIPYFMTWGLLGAGVLIAIIGFWDDKGHIPARWRLLAHFIAAIWLLYWFSGFPSVSFTGIVIAPIITTILAVFYMVWMLNLYNFMDGIDGIASIEAITVCIGATILYYVTGYLSLSILPMVLACAVAGFLVWNFPSARIFMGDAGSGFLGITLAGLSILAAWVSINFFIGWLILLGVFIVDATWTLVHRLLRKEKLYEAHRSHAYQFAARLLDKHTPVTLIILAINMLWLMPIALLVGLNQINSILGLIIAYVPLCILAYKLKAGSVEK